MILVTQSKHNGWKMWMIPMKDESNSSIVPMNGDVPVGWAWYYNGKFIRMPNTDRRIPPIVIPGLEDLYGGEEVIRSVGYRKHWEVFEDVKTGEFTFGNRPSFAKSSLPSERERAKNMVVVDIQKLQEM